MKKGFTRRLLLGLLFVGAALYLLLPVAARYGLEQWLRDQGYDQVQIEGLDIEPFAGELRIKGLKAQRGDNPEMALTQGYLNIAWLDLFKRQGHLQGLAIDGLDLAIVQDDQGNIVLSGLPLPAGQPAAEDDSRPWGVGIDRLGVRNSQLLLKLPGLHQTLKLDELVLTGLRSWEADTPADLTADAYLGTARVRLDGELTPFAATPGGKLKLRISGADIARLTAQLSDRLPATISAPGGVVDVNVRLDGRLDNGQPVVNQHGDIRVSGLTVTVDGQQQRIDRLVWKGDLAWSKAGMLTTAGKLDASGVEGLYNGTAQTIKDLAWSGKLSWAPSGKLTSDGTLQATDLNGKWDEQPQSLAGLGWQGTLAWSPKDGVQSDGTLSLSQPKVAAAGYAVALDQADWQGKAGWSPEAGSIGDGRLSLRTLAVSQPGRQLQLASVAQLDIPDIKAGSADGSTVVTLAGISAGEVVLIRPRDKPDAAPVLAAKRLTLGDSRFEAGKGLVLGELLADGARLTLVREADGRLTGLGRLTDDKTEDRQVSGAGDGKSLSLRLAGLRLTKGSDLSFTDRAVKPTFHQELKINQLVVGAMDNGKPYSWTPVSFEGQLDKYSRLALTGRVQPFSPKLNLELDGDLKAIDLPPLSSYTTEALGYAVQSGQLDSQISLKVTNDVLDGKAGLTLNKLTVKAADAKRLARLTRELSMPLDAALDMLRDGDNNIRLTLPVGGDIAKPDFDFSDIINTAMGNALKKAALSYIKYALQPYGALITLAQYAGKAANRVALKDVPFAPGSNEPAPDQSPYLDKVKQLLTERPKLQLQLCGIAVPGDRAALAEQAKSQGRSPQIHDDALRELARARSNALKSRLVDRGIDPERLFICNPEIETGDGQPRVDLLL